MVVRSKTVQKAHRPPKQVRSSFSAARALRNTEIAHLVKGLRNLTPAQVVAAVTAAVRDKRITEADGKFLAKMSHGIEMEWRAAKARHKQDDAYILPGMYFIKQRRKRAAMKKTVVKKQIRRKK